MTPLERMLHYYHAIRNVRDAIAQPFMPLFDWLGLTPNTLSFAGVVFMLAFAVALPVNKYVALILFFIALITDLFDGALARYQKRDTDKGKFVDVVCDTLIFIIFLCGLAFGGAIAFPGVFVVSCAIILSKVLRIAYNARYLKTDWKFKPVAGFIPNTVVGILYLGFLMCFTNLTCFLFPFLARIALVILLIDSVVFAVKLLKHRASH